MQLFTSFARARTKAELRLELRRLKKEEGVKRGVHARVIDNPDWADETPH